MRKIIILLFIIFTSCNSQRVILTDLNTIGIIKSVKECNCKFGKFEYLVELNPYEKIEYHSNESYNIGNLIYLKTKISKSDE